MKTLISEIQRLGNTDLGTAKKIISNFTLREINEGGYLLKQGHYCDQYFFIVSGVVRLFYVKDGKDYTVWIGTKGQVFTELNSYLNRTPSVISMRCEEKCLVYTIQKVKSDSLTKELPAYNTLLRRTVEEAFANMSKNIISFQSDTAKERYNRVEREKNWLLKFPLKYISSFIGITQSSMSRIRAEKD
ncbi:MAG: cyclic nucleotide-binding domain-containing protein [Bacteroidota bacterium]